jgi:hypothetical protein
MRMLRKTNGNDDPHNLFGAVLRNNDAQPNQHNQAMHQSIGVDNAAPPAHITPYFVRCCFAGYLHNTWGIHQHQQNWPTLNNQECTNKLAWTTQQRHAHIAE